MTILGQHAQYPGDAEELAYDLAEGIRLGRVRIAKLINQFVSVENATIAFFNTLKGGSSR